MALTEAERKRKLEQLKELERKEIFLLQQKKQYQQENKIEFFDKAPNPGPNPPQSMLLQAWNDPKYKVFTFTGGNRCLEAGVKIYDPVKKTSTPISEIKDDFHVLAWDGEKLVVAKAEKPFFKCVEPAYEICFANGGRIAASAGHQILTPDGYVSVSELRQGCAVFLPVSSSECGRSVRVSDVQSSLKTTQGSRFCCPACSRSCGGQPRQDRGSALSLVPLQGGVHGRNACANHGLMGVPGSRLGRIRLGQLFCRPSILDALLLRVGRCVGSLYRFFCKYVKCVGSCIQFGLQPICGCVPQLQSNGGFFQSANHVFCDDHNRGIPFPIDDSPLLNEVIDSPSTTITSIAHVGEKPIWDFHVPEYNNYFCEGVIHHNSGKTTSWCLIAVCTMAGEWLWSGERIIFPHNKPRKIRVIGQDFEKQVKTVVVPSFLEWWPKNRPLKIKKNSLGIETFFTDEITGSTLEIMSNSQDSDLHEGWQGDICIYDEPPRKEIRIANARGLVDRRGRELFCMTLLKEAWVDQEVIRAFDPNTGKPDRTVFSVNATIYDNVGFGITLEGVEQFAKTLDEDQKQARLAGIPSYMSGLVCKNFDRKKHLVNRFDIPLDWMVDISFDIHPRKPQYVMFIATSPYGKRYVCFEIIENGDGVFIAEQCIRIVTRYALRVNRVLIDPLSKSDANSDTTGNTTYDKIAQTLGRYGYVLETATKDKTSGILAINKHLKGPNNEPSLFFFDDLIVTIKQVEGWVYEDKGDNKGKPSKVDDDMPENLYRLLLLDTHYMPPDDEEYEDEPVCVNEVTGY